MKLFQESLKKECMKLHQLFFSVKGIKNRKVSAPLVEIALIILLQLERTILGGRDQRVKLYSNERGGERGFDGPSTNELKRVAIWRACFLSNV